MRVRSRFAVFCFLILCCLLVSRMGHALIQDVWLSSNTATADSTATLCGQFSSFSGTIPIVVPQQGVIHSIIVSSGALGTNTLQLYDSSWTVISATSSRTIGPINASSVVAPMVYDVIFRNGLSYVKSGTSIIQILYACF